MGALPSQSASLFCELNRMKSFFAIAFSIFLFSIISEAFVEVPEMNQEIFPTEDSEQRDDAEVTLLTQDMLDASVNEAGGTKTKPDVQNEMKKDTQGKVMIANAKKQEVAASKMANNARAAEKSAEIQYKKAAKTSTPKVAKSKKKKAKLVPPPAPAIKKPPAPPAPAIKKPPAPPAPKKIKKKAPPKKIKKKVAKGADEAAANKEYKNATAELKA